MLLQQRVSEQVENSTYKSPLAIATALSDPHRRRDFYTLRYGVKAKSPRTTLSKRNLSKWQIFTKFRYNLGKDPEASVARKYHSFCCVTIRASRVVTTAIPAKLAVLTVV